MTRITISAVAIPGTSFITLTRKGRAAFAEMAAAHESWVDELLGGVSVRDAEQMSAKLKSFRSDWEGEP